jgi:hypothetical protein
LGLTKQSLKQVLNVPLSRKGLFGFERVLDEYVSDWKDIIQQVNNGIRDGIKTAWIRWAAKRGASCRDQRSQKILLKLLDDGRKLHILQGYLDAYSHHFNQTKERLIEVISRGRAVFNVGWFFEWPSGRHPLNSTWPWSGVKPSLLVLWGICWMFDIMYNNPNSKQRPRFSRVRQPFSTPSPAGFIPTKPQQSINLWTIDGFE